LYLGIPQPEPKDKEPNIQKILQEEKPQVIVINGDLLDCWEISRFERVPDGGKKLKDEFSLGKSLLNKLRNNHPKARIIYTEGNHEFRMRSYFIKKAPELYDPLYIPEQLNLTKLGVEWVGTREGAANWTDTWIDIEGIKIGHFARVNKGAGQTVRNIMRDKGSGNYVQAHIHRAGIIYFTDIDGNVFWGMENPCLCKDPDYGNMTDWQRGLSFIDKTPYGWRPRVIVL